jgi:hypothetical protein
MTAVEVQLSTRFHAACTRLQHALTTLNYDKALIEWRFIHRLLDQRQANNDAE